MVTEQPQEHAEWVEDQLRYRVLLSVYERAGAHCATSVLAEQVESDVNLPGDTLSDELALLEEWKYLFTVGPGPRICITPKGIRYIEQSAGRRKSLRIRTFR